MYSQRQNLSKFSFPVKHLAQVAVKHLSGEIYAEAKALQGETSPLVGLGARWPWHFGGPHSKHFLEHFSSRGESSQKASPSEEQQTNHKQQNNKTTNNKTR